MRKKGVTVKQIQNLDRMAIEKIGIPSLVLMENAGYSVAEAVFKKVSRIKNPRVCVICGLGNNAGDGFVAARHLIDRGVKASVLLIGEGKLLKHDAAVNFHILKKLKYPIIECRKNSARLLSAIKKSDVVVDAIFGVGLNRDIRDPFQSVIETINQYAKTVIAVDTPSGLNCNTGKIYGVCVQADVTVTFTFSKVGFFKNQGPDYTGRVIVEDIGIPRKLLMVNA